MSAGESALAVRLRDSRDREDATTAADAWQMKNTYYHYHPHPSLPDRRRRLAVAGCKDVSRNCRMQIAEETLLVALRNQQMADEWKLETGNWRLEGGPEGR